MRASSHYEIIAGNLLERTKLSFVGDKNVEVSVKRVREREGRTLVKGVLKMDTGERSWLFCCEPYIETIGTFELIDDSSNYPNLKEKVIQVTLEMRGCSDKHVVSWIRRPMDGNTTLPYESFSYEVQMRRGFKRTVKRVF